VSDADFQQKVIASLAAMETKLEALVGDDQSGGRVGKLETRVNALERVRNIAVGVILTVSAAWTVWQGLGRFFLHY